MLLAIAGLILVGAIALLISNNDAEVELQAELGTEAGVEPRGNLDSGAIVAPVQQDNNRTTSYTGVGRLLSEEEIVMLETEVIELRGHRQQAPEGDDDSIEQIQSSN